MYVVLWFYEKDLPVDEISCVLFSVRHATERNKKCEMRDFSQIVYRLCDILEKDNMIQHDFIFISVYVNSGMWVDAGSRGVSTIDVQKKDCFRETVGWLRATSIGR